MQNSNIKSWRQDFIESDEELNRLIHLFEDQVSPHSDQDNIVYELMLKAGFSSSTCVQKLEEFFVVGEKELIIVLEKVTQEVIEKILFLKPRSCIMLDKLFAGDDQQKTNTLLQMQDLEIDFKTI